VALPHEEPLVGAPDRGLDDARLPHGGRSVTDDGIEDRVTGFAGKPCARSGPGRGFGELAVGEESIAR